MKVLLSTINSKYIHTSLALRWLYVVNKDRFDLSFIEFTLKQEVCQIAEELLASKMDVLGIGVYIWNVTKVAELVRLMKQKNPHLIIILGGPEVTYEPEYFLQNWPVDYVVNGEGEFVLGELLDCIQQKKEIKLEGVSSRQQINHTVVQADLEQLVQFDSPYKLAQDLKELPHKIIYFETSRGCPYQCAYCLSSLEKGVRYFEEGYIKDNMRYLIQNQATQIKFLDRTFNIRTRHASTIFNYLIDLYRPGLKCQFEIYADLLDESLIEELNNQLQADYFRFEIGIQSTHTPTNLAVNRKQDFTRVATTIRKLMEGGKIDLHLDLIAGLPYENLKRFQQSFNDVFSLEAKEVQLGFLKMLRGTLLRQQAKLYGYEYQQEAPYQIIKNNYLSEIEIDRIHRVEHAVEKYWNSGRFRRTMQTIFNSYYNEKYFQFFDELGAFCDTHGLPHYGYQLEDLYKNLHAFLQTQTIDLLNELHEDYYDNFRIRPTGFWPTGIDKKTAKRLLYQISNDKDFLKKYGLTRKEVEKRAIIAKVSENQYKLTLFLESKNECKRLSVFYIF